MEIIKKEKNKTIQKEVDFMNEKIREAIRILEEKGIPYRILDLGGKGISSQDVEKLSDVNPEEIIKTIVLRDTDENFFAAFVPGRMRIDLRKVKTVLKCKELRLAKAKELKQILGWAPGEVCPVLVKFPMIIDKTVFEREKINFGSGDLLYGIEIKTEDILKCVDAKISEIVE